jgi:hypothetical protein
MLAAWDGFWQGGPPGINHILAFADRILHTITCMCSKICNAACHCLPLASAEMVAE